MRPQRWTTAETIIREWWTESESARETMLDFIWEKDPGLYDELWEELEGNGLKMLSHLLVNRKSRWNWIWHQYNHPLPEIVEKPRPRLLSKETIRRP